MQLHLPKRDHFSLPVQVALAYSLFVLAWIILWDQLISRAPIDQHSLRLLRHSLYLVGTSVAVWWLARRTMRRMAALQARFDAVTDQAVVGIFLVRDNRLLYVNDMLCRMLGYSREVLTSRPATEFLDPTELERARVQGWGGGEDEIYRRFLARRSDGSTIPAHVVRRRVELEDGPALVGVVLDASRAEALENRLRQGANLEVLGQVTGSVTGDFDSLLTSMIGQLDRALGSLPPAQPAYGSISVVRDTARRAAALTGQLLTFTRSEVAPGQLLDVTRTIRNLHGLLASVVGPNVRIRYELDDTLSPINLDLASFDRMLASLLVNAKQASGSGGLVTVRTHAVERDGATRVAVEVEDSGAERRSVTDVAFVTARTIVEDAGGVLEVEPAPRAGTLVRVLLPPGISTARPVPAQSESARHRPGWRAGHAVLVVDDDPPVRRVTTAALRRQGYRVVEAADADSAMAQLLTDAPKVDLVICDYMLQGVTGPELVRRMKHERPDLKVLFVTGFTSKELIENDPTLSAYPFIEKPFSVEYLTASVDGLWEVA